MKLEIFKKLGIATVLPLILFGFTLATQQASPHNILVECLFISFVANLSICNHLNVDLQIELINDNRKNSTADRT